MELKNDITLEDFVEQVADDMSLHMEAKDKDYIRSHKLDVFQQHFVLGLYARNNYIYPFFNRPDVLYTSLRALQPDDISTMIVDKLIEKLRGTKKRTHRRP